MKLHRIKHALLRMSPEEKVIGVGGLAVLVATFLPWYSVTFTYDKEPVIESGFSGDLGVIGFVVFLFVLLALLVLLAENLHIRIPNFGFQKEQLMMFLMGEGAFLALLMIAVYTKRSFDFTNAELRFGIYIALIGALLGTFAAFAQIQQKQKKEAEAFFEHPPSQKKTDTKTSKREERAEEEETPETITEDEMIEDVGLSEITTDQGHFLTREAGVEPTKEPVEEPIEEEEEKKEKEDQNPSMDFYED